MKTVFVTGGARGIGRAVCRRFAQEGYAVAIQYHASAEAAHSLLQELTRLGCDAMALQSDIAQRAQITASIEAALRAWGGIDVLVNNAGVALTGLLQDNTDEQLERLFGVNLFGTLYAIQSVLPSMIRRQSGSIVNLSSIWGITGASCEAAYSASKAAVIGLTKALAQEVGPSGITVNCVAPGVIDTDMNARLSQEDRAALCAETPLGRLGSPEEAAEAVYYLATAGFVTGQVLSPNGGLVV